VTRPVEREDVTFEYMDDGGIVFAVERTRSGRLTAKARVYAHFTIDGVSYSVDAEVRVPVVRDKD
jgi:hypothetical protein